MTTRLDRLRRELAAEEARIASELPVAMDALSEAIAAALADWRRKHPEAPWIEVVEVRVGGRVVAVPASDEGGQ